jgi:hypothetical protein
LELLHAATENSVAGVWSNIRSLPTDAAAAKRELTGGREQRGRREEIQAGWMVSVPVV